MNNKLYFLYAIFLTLAITFSLQAATITISNTNDSGTGSLREAIQTANNNSQDDTIIFDTDVFSTPQTIALTSGELLINIDARTGPNRSITIDGPGANLLTISGSNNSRIFRVVQSGKLILKGVKISDGNGYSDGTQTGDNRGGAIFVTGGDPGDGSPSLTLISTVISDNVSLLFNGGSGGIFSLGDMYIEDSAIINNESTVGSGGFSCFGNLTIINSTIGKNTTPQGVGGASVFGNTKMVNTTVAYNTGRQVGGFSINGLQAENDITNSIISNNKLNENSDANDTGDLFGRLTTGTNSIVGDFNLFGSETQAINFLFYTRPQLDSEVRISDKGIPYFIHGSTSPALDGGNNCVLTAGVCSDIAVTEDLREVMRPVDGNGNGTATVDIGTFEATRDEVLAAPAVAPDLRAVDDSGESDSDNITNETDLTFDVGGFASGIFVEFLRNGEIIGSQTADGSTLVFNDQDVPEGVHTYSTRQTIDGIKSIPGAAITVDVDLTGPTPRIFQPATQKQPATSQPIDFAFTFNETVVGFEASDVSFNDSTANVSQANVSVTGDDGQNFIVSISNILSDGSVVVTTTPDIANDLAGNSSLEAFITDNVNFFDTGAASVTINQAATQADPTNDTEIDFTVVFSEQVVNFGADDISLADSTVDVSNATISVTGFGANYQVTVGNFSTPGGMIVAKVVAGAAIDAVGNPSLASTSTDNSVFVDTVGPSVTINQADGQADPTNQMPIKYTVVFSEEVVGFDNTDVFLLDTSANTDDAVITITGSGTQYEVSIDGITSNGGNVRAFIPSFRLQDVLGNNNFSSTSTDNTITIDNIGPIVRVRQPNNQPDPTSVQPIRFSVIFNEDVTGFDIEDISLAGSTVNVSSVRREISGSGRTYTISISNIRVSGQVRLTVPPNAVQDAFGNPSLASINEDNVITVKVKQTPAPIFDFDGDGKTDVSIFRPGPNPAQYWILRSSDLGNNAYSFGLGSDKPIPADYTGDGKTDLAFFRESSSEWFVLRSEDSTFYSFQYGAAGDIPAPGDFDGDGIADYAVFRPLNSTWFINRSSDGQTDIIGFGIAEDQPVVADYDGDGMDDIAIYRPSSSQWWLNRSSDGILVYQFGTTGDKTVQGDYTGDGKADVAFWRPTSGEWFVIRSEDQSFFSFPFGSSGDIAVPGDYDGDGQADAAVFRPSQTTWYLNGSTSGTQILGFGFSDDIPLANSFVRE